MFKRKVRARTCFLMGVVAGLLYVLAGVLTLLGLGAASYLHLSAFAFTGGMLLFLTTTQSGDAGKATRLKLLGLFLLLLVSYPNLPPVSTLAGAVVIPLLGLMYTDRPGRPLLLALAIAEAAYLVVATLLLVNASLALPTVLLLIVCGALRGAVCWWLFKIQPEANITDKL